MSDLIAKGLRTSCSGNSEQESITISGAFALYPLTVRGAEELKKVHPEISLNVSAGGPGKGFTDVLTGMVDLGIMPQHLVDYNS
jgi:phosphate transport system substrate-binding protein